jgi:hypothetical protein
MTFYTNLEGYESYKPGTGQFTGLCEFWFYEAKTFSFLKR